MPVLEGAAPAQLGQMAVWVALGGGNSGIVGDARHGSGFHRGASFVPATDYSRRRDPNGSDGPFSNWGYCCAGDYHHGGKTVLRARHVALLTRLMDADPLLDNVCEFIGQPWADRPVYYWSVWNGRRVLQKYTGAGHDMWSHISTWRSDAVREPQLWVTSGGQGGGAPVPTKPADVKPVAPPWPVGPHDFFRPRANAPVYATVRLWEARMKQRGWPIKVDGRLSVADGAIIRKFQKEKGLGVDGLLGPVTYRTAWTAKVT